MLKAILVATSLAVTPAAQEIPTGEECATEVTALVDLTQTAASVNGDLVFLLDAKEITSFIKVVQETVRDTGEVLPADSLMIAVHPSLQSAMVMPVRNGRVCEYFMLSAPTYAKAIRAAKGDLI
jgi:hypothetical protein